MNRTAPSVNKRKVGRPTKSSLARRNDHKPQLKDPEAWRRDGRTNSPGSHGRKLTPRSRVMRAGILAALEVGPATAREIRDRMGIAPPQNEICTILRVMERQGFVKEITRTPNPTMSETRNDYFSAPVLWALVEALP